MVIDQIQKVPELLDEVHRLIENRGWRFALAGSSARKLRRQGTNPLGGRALTRQLESFYWKELGAGFELDSALRWGLLPGVCLDQARAADLRSPGSFCGTDRGKGAHLGPEVQPKELNMG